MQNIFSNVPLRENYLNKYGRKRLFLIPNVLSLIQVLSELTHCRFGSAFPLLSTGDQLVREFYNRMGILVLVVSSFFKLKM